MLGARVCVCASANWATNVCLFEGRHLASRYTLACQLPTTGNGLHFAEEAAAIGACAAQARRLTLAVTTANNKTRFLVPARQQATTHTEELTMSLASGFKCPVDARWPVKRTGCLGWRWLMSEHLEKSLN